MMQKITVICAPVVVFFLLLFAYVKLAGPIPFVINSVTTTKSDTFSVEGTGKVSVKPDSATVSVGVTGNGTTVNQVQDQLNANSNKVITAIKKLGVADADIKTENYSITPTYDYRTGNQSITGYNATTNITVTIKNLDQVNAVIDAATQNGANQVGGVTFDVADKTAAQDQARQKAVADAKLKAENAAKIAGFHLGSIVNYTENFAGEPVPNPRMALDTAAQGSAQPTNVQAGSNDISVTVTLSYAIQ